MASSTIKLSTTLGYAEAFNGLRPLVGIGGIPGEPAMSMATQVLQFILGAPFSWPWNRATNTFTTLANTQDYEVSVPDMGWLEKAVVTDANGKIWELEISLCLADTSSPGRPLHLAVQLEDEAGNTTFRLDQIPAAGLTVKLIYQKRATPFTSVNSLWAPVPDQFSNLYTSLFLALAFEQSDDARFAAQQQMALKQLLGTVQGLSETQLNVFMAEILIDAKQRQAAIGARQ